MLSSTHALALAEAGLLVVVLALAGAAFVVFAGVAPSDRQLQRFALVYEVRVTTANTPLLSAAIRWSRAWRLAGALTALAAKTIIELAGDRSLGAAMVWVAVGYAVGATVGEATRRLPRDIGGRRRATLDRRRARDFVRPWVLHATVASSCLAILATLRYWQLARDGVEDEAGFGWMPSPTALAPMVAAALLFVAAQLGVATLVARRPQPPAGDDLDAANHAVRSAAIVSLTGSALMTASLTTSLVMMRVSWQAGGRHDVLSNLHGAAQAMAVVGVLIGFGLSLRSIPRFLPMLGGRNERTATSS